MKIRKLISFGITATLATCLTFPSIAVAAPTQVSASNSVLTTTLRQGETAPNHLDLTMDGQAVVSKQIETKIGPGVWLTEFERLEPRGWQQGAVLDVDLANPAVSLDYLYTGKVASTSTVRKLADEAENIAGAINGDGFDINNSGASNGIGIHPVDGVIEAPNTPVYALVLDKNNIAQITSATTEGKIVGNSFELPVAMVNYTNILDRDKDNTVGIYTSYWGDYKRLNRNNDRDQGVEIWIDETSKVVKEAQPVGEGAIPAGTRIIVARPGSAAETLKTARLGETVQVSYGLRTNADQPSVGIGGWSGNDMRLVQDGVNRNIGGAAIHPRTAVGVGQNGTRLLMVVIDGRSTNSRGMTLSELGDFMIQLGAHNALNLDGGGSTTLVARDPGDTNTTVINTPSDGSERHDGNGLGVTVTPGTQGLTGFNVQPATKAPNANRIFPNAHRRLTAKGHDENLTPVQATPTTWTSANPQIATVDNNGVVTGIKPGKTTITAATGQAKGTYEIEVIGDLNRVIVSPNTLAIPDPTASMSVDVMGFDANGFGSSIEAQDITVGGDSALVDLTNGSKTTYTVKAAADTGSGTFTLTVGNFKNDVAVTIGTVDHLITSMDEAETWWTYGARATSSASAANEGHGAGDTKSVAIDYKFNESTSTRTANIRTTDEVVATWPLPDGNVQSVGAWFKGQTGENPMVYFAVADREDKWKWLYGARIEGDQWQYISVPVPQDLAHPVQVMRIAVYETVGSKQYTGRVLVDDVNAIVAPKVKAPKVPVYQDPAVSLLGAADGKPLRIGVVSDAQFVGRNPNSANANAAREVLAQVVERKPDRILIVGDWVDEGAAEDIALAKQIIDEALADTNIPWTYVPGNHEAMGAPDLAPWKAVFGETKTVTDVNNTRIITIDSHPYNISYDPAQVLWLEQQLNEAKTNPNITGVVLALHHPTQDNLTGASALNDPQDARLIEQWMADVKAAGKSALVLNAGVGAFDVYQVDGAVHLTNGNSGKGPHSTPDRGGFTGWTMIGIDPANGLWREATGNWLAIEINPFVDKLTITGPNTLETEESISLNAVVTQDTREVPVAWPVSYRWASPTSNVYVGPTDAAPANAIAAIDPATGVVTGLDRVVIDQQIVPRDGAKHKLLTGQANQYPITLTVTVNGVTSAHQVMVNVSKAEVVIADQPTPSRPDPVNPNPVNPPADTPTLVNPNLVVEDPGNKVLPVTPKKLPRTGVNNVAATKTGTETQNSKVLIILAGIVVTLITIRRHPTKTTK